METITTEIEIPREIHIMLQDRANLETEAVGDVVTKALLAYLGFSAESLRRMRTWRGKVVKRRRSA